MDEKIRDNKLNKSIRELVKRFQESPFYFLSEHDIQAYLYNQLIEEFKEYDTKETTSIHCELSSINDSGASDFRPDISICDPRLFKTTQKGFNFYFDDENTISVEIKYCINESNISILKKLWDTREKKGDYYKLCKFQEFGSIILLFDNQDCLKIDDLINVQKENNDFDNNIKIIYVTPHTVKCVMNSKECALDN